MANHWHFNPLNEQPQPLLPFAVLQRAVPPTPQHLTQGSFWNVLDTPLFLPFSACSKDSKSWLYCDLKPSRENQLVTSTVREMF